MKVQVADLPLWLPLGFAARWPKPLGELNAVPAADWVERAPAAAHRTEEVRASVRGLLRAGGHKPSGRGKPASEYLVRAFEEGGLPEINPVVDLLNAVSFVCGIPISVIDLDKAQAPFEVRNGHPDEEYVFNASGQTIRLKGLLNLCDSEGPCANAVKDCQRTKTSEASTHTFHILWAPEAQRDVALAAFDWYVEESRALGGDVTVCSDWS